MGECSSIGDCDGGGDGACTSTGAGDGEEEEEEGAGTIFFGADRCIENDTSSVVVGVRDDRMVDDRPRPITGDVCGTVGFIFVCVSVCANDARQ